MSDEEAEGLIIPTLWVVEANERDQDGYRTTREASDYFESQADAVAKASELNDGNGWAYDGYYRRFGYSVSEVNLDVAPASGLTLEDAERDAQERYGAYLAAHIDMEQKRARGVKEAEQKLRDAIFREEAAARGLVVPEVSDVPTDKDVT